MPPACAPADSCFQDAARREWCSASLALNGVGTLSYSGRTLLMSHPETGWLITEYGLSGTPLRSIGQLRKTGHEGGPRLAPRA